MDSFYDSFGLAIDLVADKAQKLGAIVVPERSKIDLDPNKEDEERCKQYAQTVASMITAAKNKLTQNRL